MRKINIFCVYLTYILDAKSGVTSLERFSYL